MSQRIRIWSDEKGHYIDAESVSFTGPGATHTLLPEGEARMQRRHPLADCTSMRRDELVSSRELKNGGHDAASWKARAGRGQMEGTAA